MPEDGEQAIIRTFEDQVSLAERQASLTPLVTPLQLHHYTTAEGIKGIVQSRKIWCTHYAYLNDSSELKYAKHLLDDLIEAREGNDNPVTAAVLAAIRNTSNGMLATADTFVACFCEQDDLLSQWRAYGSSGGYALNLCWKGTHNFEVGKQFTLRKVIYDAPAQATLLSAFLDYFATAIDAAGAECSPEDVPETLFVELELGASHLQSVLAMPRPLREVCWAAIYKYADIAPFLKHPTFRSEQEWRLAHTRNIPPTPYDDHLNFRTQRGLVIPYLDVELYLKGDRERSQPGFQPNFSLDSITVGPNVNPQAAKHSIDMLLKRQLPETRITIQGSNIPVIL